jgi:two-component system sensor histidine kinase/response regulator
MIKSSILLVEDDPILRAMTVRQLTVLGFKAVAVASGEEALEKWSDYEPDMIFMDIGLPGIDGTHATMLIRETELREQRRRIPIIALTGHSDRARCVSAGMDDFMQKPALLNDLKTMVSKWVAPSPPSQA